MNSEYEKSNTSYTNRTYVQLLAEKGKKASVDYTEKDFPAIYIELLNLAKELSYKWDPTISNESDPLVVMLKELALIADKINYSSDKLALESMPLSATQEENARALYELLDYYPKWYNSCEQTLYMAWNKSTTDSDGITYDEDYTVTIPQFTQVRDEDGNYTYTTTEDVTVPFNGDAVTVKAIEGFRRVVKINNDIEVIKINNLDAENRLYLQDYAVAENGIFVYYANTEDAQAVQSESGRWQQVKNLFSQELGNTYYSFGVDQRTKQCYLQFPEDIPEMILGGLSVSYIVTSGIEGVAPIGQLTEFSDTQLKLDTSASSDRTEGQKTVDINGESVFLTNTEILTVPSDPESIDQQYKNYKRVSGTFDTLVTLRDYCNALYETATGLTGTVYAASNGYICDRTNDIQQSYKVV